MAAQIDDEIQAFIDRTNSFYPPDAVDGSIEQQRGWYNALCKAFHNDHPPGVTVQDDCIPTDACDVPVRRYGRANGSDNATVLYLHGGGFVVGGLDSHDDVCAEICQATGFPVVSVDYRLSPEHVHPAAFDDALAAYDCIAREGRPVILVGDSAGGCLAASVSIAARDRDDARIKGQVLIYPALGGSPDGLSRREHADAPMLSAKDVDYYGRMRCGGQEPVADSRCYALAARRFDGLPPTIMFPAEIDPLRDDCAEFAERLQKAGVPVENHIHQGLVHGHLRARHVSRLASDAFGEICDAIARLGDRNGDR